jgi:hypothetical protein
MSNDKQLLEQALEILHYLEALNSDTQRQKMEAITAIRARLEQPEQERNFCERCGKRLGGEGHIHTCTPPAAQEEIQRLSALVRAQQITIDKLEKNT